jgi:hypothetical protein
VTRRLALKLAATVLGAFSTGLAFSLYLKPGMLIEFANLVLCY